MNWAWFNGWDRCPVCLNLKIRRLPKAVLLVVDSSGSFCKNFHPAVPMKDSDPGIVIDGSHFSILWYMIEFMIFVGSFSFGPLFAGQTVV
jgi:hypothetical protein